MVSYIVSSSRATALVRKHSFLYLLFAILSAILLLGVPGVNAQQACLTGNPDCQGGDYQGNFDQNGCYVYQGRCVVCDMYNNGECVAGTCNHYYNCAAGCTDTGTGCEPACPPANGTLCSNVTDQAPMGPVTGPTQSVGCYNPNGSVCDSSSVSQCVYGLSGGDCACGGSTPTACGGTCYNTSCPANSSWDSFSCSCKCNTTGGFYGGGFYNEGGVCCDVSSWPGGGLDCQVAGTQCIWGQVQCNATCGNTAPANWACNDNNSCTTDTCQSNGSCSNPAVSCPWNQTCSGGSCGCYSAGTKLCGGAGGLCIPNSSCCTNSDCQPGGSNGSIIGGVCNFDGTCGCNFLEHQCGNQCFAGNCCPGDSCEDGWSCTADSCVDQRDNGTSTPHWRCEHTTSCNNPPECKQGSGSCSGGNCSYSSAGNSAPGTACSDEVPPNACTADTCDGAGGCAHTPITCPSDGLNCTADTCSASSGCQHVDTCTGGRQCTSFGCCTSNFDTGCDDLNPCTSGEKYNCDGQCVGGTNNTASCSSDGLSCTTDVCSGGSCQHNNTCTGGFECTAGGCCSPNMNDDCDDGNVCTSGEKYNCAGNCAGGSNNSNSCDDGEFCTGNDTCSGGICVGGSPPACDDGDSCTSDSCPTGGTVCVHTNTCSCTNNGQCNDSNPCTNDACSGGSCTYVNNSLSCDDNDSCTSNDICSGGICVGGPDVCGGTCGNPTTCDVGEDCANCPGDCGACASSGVCGNNVVNSNLPVAGDYVASFKDYDGDLKADPAIWRVLDGSFRIIKSSNGQPQAFAPHPSAPLSGAISVPRDYDGDGKMDTALWQPSNGTWYITSSIDGSNSTTAWGMNGDIPVPADYDGDGKTDLAVWRQTDSNWYVRKSTDSSSQIIGPWGLAAAPYNDLAVQADYDGDGKADPAVWRRQTGVWYVLQSGSLPTPYTPWTMTWGDANAPNNDIPVPGNYDGTDPDGKKRADPAVWRRTGVAGTDGAWRILQSSNGYAPLPDISWGASYAPYNDVPAPADYDGDGKTDPAVWRKQDGNWYVKNSSTSSPPWTITALTIAEQCDDGCGGNGCTLADNGDGCSYICQNEAAVDTTFPTCSAGNNGMNWRGTWPAVIATASDNIGVTSLKYSWDLPISGGVGTTTTSGTNLALTPPPDGNHTLYIECKDAAGNTGLWNGIYKVDQTAPATPVITVDTLSKTATTITVASSWSSTDAESGVTGNEYCFSTDGTTCAVTTPPPPSFPALQYYPLTYPVRLLDTRVGQSACSTPNAAVNAGTSFTQQARGTCQGLDIPANAQAIEANLTVIAPGSNGRSVVYPSGSVPNTSSLNYAAGQIVGGHVTSGLASDGTFKLYSTVTANYAVDVFGYYAPPASGSYYHVLPKPVRMVDTRLGSGSCKSASRLGANERRTLSMIGGCEGYNIPSNATAVAGSITVIIPDGNGYVNITAAGQPLTTTANLNFLASQVRANGFVSRLSTGSLIVTSTQGTDVVIDIEGYYSSDPSDTNGSGLLYTPLTNQTRIVDTRVGQTACQMPGAPLSAGTSVTYQNLGAACVGGFPATALAMSGAATVVSPSAQGFIRLFGAPAVGTLTNASINYTAGQNTTTGFHTGLGPSEALGAWSVAQTDLTLDATGYYTLGGMAMVPTGGTAGFTSVTYPYTSGPLFLLVRTRNAAGTYSALGSVTVPPSPPDLPLPKPVLFPNSGEYYSPITVTLDATGTNAENLFTAQPPSAPTGGIYLVSRVGFDNSFSSDTEITNLIGGTSWPDCPSSGPMPGSICRVVPGSQYQVTLPYAGSSKDASYALIARFASGTTWVGRRYRMTILDPVIENVRYNTSVTPNKVEVTVRNAGSKGKVILRSAQSEVASSANSATYVPSNVTGGGEGLAIISTAAVVPQTSTVRYVQVARDDVDPAKNSALYSYRFPEGTNISSNVFTITPAKTSVRAEESVTLTAKLPGTNTAQAELTWTVELPAGATGYIASDLTSDPFPTGKGNQRVTFKALPGSKGKKFIVKATVVGSSSVVASAEVQVVDQSLTDLSRHMFIEKLPGTSVIYLNTAANPTNNTQLQSNQTPTLLLSSEIVTGVKVVFQGQGNMAAGQVTIKGVAVADSLEHSFVAAHNVTVDLFNSTACVGGCKGIKNPYLLITGLPSGTGNQANKVLLSMTNDGTIGLDGVISVSSDIKLPRALAPLTYVYTDSCFQIGVVLKNAQDVPEAVVTGTCPVTVPTSATTNTTTCMSGGDPGPIGIFTGEQCVNKLRGYLGCPDGLCP